MALPRDSELYAPAQPQAAFVGKLVTTADTTRPAPAPAETAFVWTSAHILALLILLLAQLLEFIDITVVNVALPTMRTDLRFSQTNLQWVVNAYTVCFGGFLLLGGRAGDLLGKRRVLLGGITLFTVASLASGLAQDANTLITTRALQGLSCAFVSPMTLALIAMNFPEGKPRNLALGLYGGIAGISSALGVTIGGLLVSGPGWRWIFYINIPVGLFLLTAAPRYLKADRPTHRHRRFDLLGALTATGGVGLLAYAVSQTNEHAWGSSRTIGLLAGAAALLVYLVIHETLIAGEPLIPLSIFKNRSVTGANVIGTLWFGALFSTFYFLSLYEQQVLHYSALKTGLAYLPLCAIFIPFTGIAPVLVPRVGVRFVLALGSLIAIGGLLLLARISPHGDLWRDVIVPTLVLGSGLALLFVPTTIAAVAGVLPSQTGLASGLSLVTRNVGAAVVLAVLATLATNRTDHQLQAGHALNAALTDGFKLGFTISAVMMGVSVLAALLLFRNEGRGQRVNMAELAAAGIEDAAVVPGPVS
ncbi:MAG TPA: MFS transporter [Chloroflexota bacterium]|nr:MFS transporter [Chloroflexota bacterium]